MDAQHTRTHKKNEKPRHVTASFRHCIVLFRGVSHDAVRSEGYRSLRSDKVRLGKGTRRKEKEGGKKPDGHRTDG